MLDNGSRATEHSKPIHPTHTAAPVGASGRHWLREVLGLVSHVFQHLCGGIKEPLAQLRPAPPPQRVACAKNVQRSSSGTKERRHAGAPPGVTQRQRPRAPDGCTDGLRMWHVLAASCRHAGCTYNHPCVDVAGTYNMRHGALNTSQPFACLYHVPPTPPPSLGKAHLASAWPA